MAFPALFLKRMEDELGAEFPAFLAAMEQPVPVSVRLNPSKSILDFEDSQPIPWHPDGRYLPERLLFTLDPRFQAGAYYVQEASSMMIHEALRQAVGIGQALRVLDFCAAPGGKTTLLLSAINQDGLLLANEAIQSRIAPLKMNLEKWGHPNVAVSNHDPSDFGQLAGFFEVVLVDAPCSGEGLFRKDEGAAAHWSESSVELCAARQHRILTEAMHLVKQGGILLYSTCTFNSLENEQNVKWLIENGGFEEVKIEMPHAWGVVEKKLGYQCYPHRVKGEGFYFACLRKTAENPVAKAVSKPPKDWQRLTNSQMDVVSGFIAKAADYEYFMKPNSEILALPKQHLDDFFTIGAALRKRTIGLDLGELKKNDLVPSHSVALSNSLHPNMPRVELTRQQALTFLKKENVWEPDWQRGWAVASYDGLPLGWLKVLDNRSNNYLPTEWRIRMAIKGKKMPNLEGKGSATGI